MGAALAAIATLSTVAAKAAPTKTMLQLDNRRISLMNYSGSNQQLTTGLKQALGLVDVRVLDHFVVAGNQTMSFAEQGLI